MGIAWGAQPVSLSMSASLKIALLYPTSLPWMAELVDGVRRYGLQFGGWQLLTCPPSIAATGERSRTLHSLVGWHGDGAIAVIRSEEDRELARQLGIPVVNLSGWEADAHGVPRVSVDNRLAGRLAAEHLLERGLRHFAYLGWEQVHYSEERLAGFRERIQEEGLEVGVLLGSPEDGTRRTLVDELQSVSSWMQSLPLPCGVFAVHDYRAQLVLEACASIGLRVPRDVAVIGMDDDRLVCEHSSPTLTSVTRNASGIGWEAAALIDRILRGEVSGTPDILVAPDGVSERQSTDLYHHPDEIIQLAVAFMLGNLRDDPKVDAIARHAGVSRRTLELRFRSCTGRSPRQYLTEAKVGHAKKLLRGPSKRNLRQLATECGFTSYPAFVAAFQSLSGQTPSEYRKSLLERARG